MAQGLVPESPDKAGALRPFQYHKRHRVIGLVAYGDVRSLHPKPRGVRVRVAHKDQPRTPQGVVRHTDIAQAKRPPKPRPQGLGGRLLGRKALGQEMSGARGHLKLAILGDIQDAARIPGAKARKPRLEPRHPYDIGADADDHAGAALASMSRFISATAGARPVNTARAMIACPILSSRTPGMAATASTLW